MLSFCSTFCFFFRGQSVRFCVLLHPCRLTRTKTDPGPKLAFKSVESCSSMILFKRNLSQEVDLVPL